MTTYRVELQIPYGTLVDVYEGGNRTLASHRYAQFLRLGKGKGFIPCFVNGKEVAPSRMRMPTPDGYYLTVTSVITDLDEATGTKK